jgi:hypothetical protein
MNRLTRRGNLLRRNNRLERKQDVTECDPIAIVETIFISSGEPNPVECGAIRTAKVDQDPGRPSSSDFTMPGRHHPLRIFEHKVRGAGTPNGDDRLIEHPF